MNDYPKKIILALIEAFKGNEEIFQWLIENKPELAAFVNNYKNKDLQAMKWLVDKKYTELYSIIYAIDGIPDAFKWLKIYDYKVSAIIVLATRGDDDAMSWLYKNDIYIFELAKELRRIYNAREEEDNDFFVIMKRSLNPFAK